MTEYIEIVDPDETHRLYEHLAKKLKQALHHEETRTIGSPGGSSPGRVQFLSDTGDNVFFSREWLSKDKRTEGILFSHGTPNSNTPLNMDIQFNFGVAQFSRRRGGAFLVHSPTKRVVLAHRGITTVGRRHIPKAELFQKMAATVREAKTGKGTGEFLLIGELESPTLVNDIDVFSRDIRYAKNAEDEHETPSGTSVIMGRLRQYFDESSGERQIKGRGKSIADCYHGQIVQAIKVAFDSSAETRKSQAIDLAVLAGKRIYLFEVKTSSKLQNIYTAIGQLTVHAAVVAKYAPRKRLVRVMVLPERPRESLCRQLTDQLGIRLLTFSRSAQGRITIKGIDGLKQM